MWNVPIVMDFVLLAGKQSNWAGFKVCSPSVLNVEFFRAVSIGAEKSRYNDDRAYTMTSQFMCKILRFLHSEDGLAAVEYALMLAMKMLVALTAISSLGQLTAATFENLAEDIAD